MNKYNTLLEQKYSKAIKKAKTKVPYTWNQDQIETFFIVMSNAPRLRNNDEIIRYSIFKNNNLIENKGFIKNFFNYYYFYNTMSIANVCGYEYLDFNLKKEYIIDHYEKDVSFKGFNFSKNDLYQSLMTNKNFTPLYAYVNKQKNFYRICGGRHRIQILKNINNFIQFAPLCIFWDNMPERIECNIYIPNIFLEKSLYLLKDIIIIEKQEDFSLCLINNPVDLWLTMKTFDKEVSYLIDFHEDLLKSLNIISPENIMWKSLLKQEEN